MPTSMDDFITRGLYQMSLKDPRPNEKSTEKIVKASSRCDFKPVIQFVNREGRFKIYFEKDGGIEKILKKFLNNGHGGKLTVGNYKSIMKLAPMIELWNEFELARSNTEPNDTFQAGLKIDDHIIDYGYEMPIEGNSIRISCGKLITFTTNGKEKITAVVQDILDEQLVLKRLSNKEPTWKRGKVPLKKVYFEPNDRNFLNISNGIDALEPRHLKVLFPGSELPDHYNYKDGFRVPPFLNQEQRTVVDRITNISSPHPFILFGPPGTGKTRTICESIKLLYEKRDLYDDPWQLIIVAAPSNAAIDNIVKKLVKFIPLHEVMRLVSVAKSSRIDEDIKKFSEVLPGEVHKALEKGVLKILCGTLQVLGKLSQRKVKASHIFVDEAGQATESDILVVWPALAQETGQLILAGDPHQLGPVVMTEGAKCLGHEKSMMKRLMEFPFYKKRGNGEFNKKFVVQLVKNYRSLPELLEVPNKLFYEMKLEAQIKPSRDMIIPYYIEKTMCPLIFYDIKTKHSRFGTSSQNKGQAFIVMKTIEKLLKNGVPKSEIGIITPYTGQVKLIQDWLRERKLAQKPKLFQGSVPVDGITVGSVERFQGNERRVIILSTVKSGYGRNNLGFLTDYQRMNVAVTRAKELLVVIGNPQLLKKDKNWREIINFTKTHNSYFKV